MPTGWEVVLDLLRKMPGAPRGGDEDALVAWYREQNERDPSYSDLLGTLAKGTVERRNLLRQYFEPNEQEREEGVKLPTAAHRSLARLVALGMVRVIVTTNFDRLMEQALADEGIIPDIISHEDMIDGAVPLPHSKCLIFKIHGDYIDTRLRNTEAELAEYPQKILAYLDRILEDHGLIVCGWSASYDPALASRILVKSTRRYGMYWLLHGELSEAAADIVADRRPSLIWIESADYAFEKILEHVEALQDLEKPRPLDVAMASATAKRYLSKPEHAIQLHDLLMDEATNLVLSLDDPELSPEIGGGEGEAFFNEYKRRIAKMEQISQRFLAIGCAVMYYGTREHASVVANALEIVADPPLVKTGAPLWIAMRKYPSLLALHMLGTAAVVGKREVNAAQLLYDARVTDPYQGERQPLVYKTHWFEILGQNKQPEVLLKQKVSDRGGYYAPADEYMAKNAPRFLHGLYAKPDAIDHAYERFQMLLQMAYMHFDRDEHDGELARDWAPLGRFYLIGRRSNWEKLPQGAMEKELRKLGATHPLMQVGFYDGDVASMTATLDALKGFLQRVGSSAW